MKKLLSFLKRPWMVLLLTLLSFEIVVFFTWQRLSHTPGLRLHVMLLIAVVVLVLICVDALRRYLEAQRSTAELQALGGSDPQAIKRALDQSFARLADAVPRRGSFYKEDSALGMPWILVIGPPGCGKSTALRKGALAAEIVVPETPGAPCRFWLSDQAVFLEVSWPLVGVPEPTQKSAKNAELDWQVFLHWLHGRRTRIDAVVVQVAVDEILSAPPAQTEYAAGQLRRALGAIGMQLGAVPVRLLLGRCDRIDGFRPFFAELDAHERAQAWGCAIDGSQGGRSPGSACARGLQGLADAALMRSSARAVQLPSTDREAVLGFPCELARYGEVLRSFLDLLFHGGRDGILVPPAEFFLMSAHMSGGVLPAGRLELAISHQRLTLPATQSPALAQDDDLTPTFFLLGAFSRITQLAQQAVQPRRRWQILALAVCGSLCVTSSAYFAYGYAAEYRRIQREIDLASVVYGATLRLGEVDSLSTLDHGKMHAELDLELALLDFLCPGYPAKGCAMASATADGALSQSLVSFRKGVSLFLRKRIAERFVAPLVRCKKDDRNPFYTGLRDAAAWRQGEEGAHGEKLARGFKALKAVAILQKSGESCPTKLEPQDVSWAVSYFGELWQQRDRLDSELREKLQNSLAFFFGEYALDYSRENQTRFGLEFNQELVNLAKDHLRGLGETPSDAKYYLIASERQLYGRALQLRSRFELLTDNPPGSPDAGIRQVFTRDGCVRFFAADRHSERWYACVLRENSSQRPNYVEPEIIAHYNKNFRQEWMQWLSSVSLSAELRVGDLAAISKALSDAPRELDRLLAMVGSGVSVKSGETAAAPTKPSPELLRVCQDAANQTASFRLSVSPDAETDPEAREDAQALATLYQRYRTSLGTAGQQLAPLSRTPAPQDETATIRSALTALSDVVRARADWMARLNRDLERRTPELPKVTAEALNTLLHRLEGAAWDSLVGPDGSYGKAIDKEWKKIVADWDSRADKSADDAAACEAVRGFLSGRVAPFVTSQLSGVFFDRGTCLTPPIGDPTQPRDVICTRSCRAILDAAALAESGPRLCCKAQPAAQPPPAPAPRPEDFPFVDSTSASCGSSPYETVDIEAGSLRPPQRYRCSLSSGQCRLQPQAVTPEQNSISVTKTAPGSTPVPVTPRAASFYALVRGHDIPNMVKRGRVASLFALPSEGKCSDIHLAIYLTPAMKAPPPQPTAHELCPWQRAGFLPRVLVPTCTQ